MEESGRRKTRSGTSDVERYRRILADKAEALEWAIGRRNVKSINRAAEAAEAALVEVERAIDTEATVEATSPVEVDRAKEGYRAPVRELFKRAREVIRQVAVAEWA